MKNLIKLNNESMLRLQFAMIAAQIFRYYLIKNNNDINAAKKETVLATNELLGVINGSIDPLTDYLGDGEKYE